MARSSASGRWTRMTLLAAVALAALIAVPVARAGEPPMVGHTGAASSARAKRIERYWTPQRMRRAEPLPLASGPTEPLSSPPKAAPSSAKPMTVPPSLPKGEGPAYAPRATIIPNPSAYPYSTQGKLFERDRTGDYVCSATIVNTPSQRVVFSAGHCARESGIWASKEVFVPGYRHGHAPYGKFAAWQWYVPDQWYRGENDSYDFSAIVLYQKVANIVGSRGWASGYPANQHYVSYGYPAGRPYNGEDLYSCPSYLGGRDASTGNPETMWITCDMTGGSSGGGWIIDNKYLNGVNSYGYRGYPNRMYGPYFGSGFASFYNYVKNKTP